jgi:hypothetical protein
VDTASDDRKRRTIAKNVRQSLQRETNAVSV